MEPGTGQASFLGRETEKESATGEASPSRLEEQHALEDTKEKAQSQDKPAAAAEVFGLRNNAAGGTVGADNQNLPVQTPVVPPRSHSDDSRTTATDTLHNSEVLQVLAKEESFSTLGNQDYFIPDASLPVDVRHHTNSRVTSTSTLASSAVSSVDIQHDTASTPYSPPRLHSSSQEPPIPTTNSDPSTKKPPRPTSVPILMSTSPSTRRRRDGPECPRYPDQSFAALQSPPWPASYQPHPLRTRSSHASQNSSFSSIPSRNSRDQIALVTGAKTVGGTPAQSPGLFSPVYPASRSQMDESEDSQSSTPLMHPAHTQTPKETHVLSKEVDPDTGRKTLNNYELLKVLGKGQHGTVKLGRNMETGDSVAVKIVRRHPRKRRLRRTEDSGEMIKREIAILKKARHPHVVSLLEVIDDEQSQKVYLILEFVELGEIVWRKVTDKDVAMFELNRIKRELKGHVDKDFEAGEVDRFNSTAVTRRSQKAQVLQQRTLLPERGVDVNELSRPTSAASEEPFWGLEHGGELEDDAVQTLTAHGGLGLHVAPGLAYNESPYTRGAREPYPHDTPETPKPLPIIGPATFSANPKPTSSPVSPVHLSRPMFGPYTGDEHSNESQLQSFLHHSLTAEKMANVEWTAEEKEFMWVPCLTLSQASDAFRDTVLGLEFLHYQGIIHRDIKPANLLWTAARRVKISDFGVSYLGKPIRPEANNDDISSPDAADVDEAIELAKTVGTPAFYAPELCDPDLFSSDNKNQRPPITGQIDVWALGVTLYGMIFGRLPFWDANEFGMYEKIANEPLWIPRRRLKGVEDTPKEHMNSNKRFDDIVEYEDVDDELCHLLTRLLDKDPSKRITIKEVKRHPWVLRGVQNQPTWIEETDPDLQSEGRKIEISNQDLQEAVIPVSIVDRIKSGVRRMGSALSRGRHRKRAESDIKDVESAGPTRPPKANSEGPEWRKTSLRGDEQLFTSALRASRENSEHPLSQSVTASPEQKANEDYFDDTSEPSKSSSPGTQRPILPDRSVSSISTAESMRTIRPTVPPLIKENSLTPTGSLSTTEAITGGPAPSNFGGLFGGSRRYGNKLQGWERGRSRDGPSAGSSRSSSISIEAFPSPYEDPHGSPSLAFSTAVAAGHVDQPSALRNGNLMSAPPRQDSRSDGFQRAPDFNDRRRVLESSQTPFAALARHRATSLAAHVPCPPSPDVTTFPSGESPSSTAPADEAPNFGISSSSEQMASNISESFSHPSIPSVSGASSFSGLTAAHEYPLEKTVSPSTIVPEKDSLPDLSDDFAQLTPNADDIKAASEDDEAGYNGEEELDSDSDDGGLEMGGAAIRAHSPTSAVRPAT
ncbi:MAG: hypothetical protein Q9185_003903 [Variospora sp. 1 TL-2023]